MAAGHFVAQRRQRDGGILIAADRDAIDGDERVNQAPHKIRALIRQQPTGGLPVQAGIQQLLGAGADQGLSDAAAPKATLQSPHTRKRLLNDVCFLRGGRARV